MTGTDLTAQFTARIPWDRGYLKPVTDRIEYEPVAKDSAAPTRTRAGSPPRKGPA